MTKIKLDQHYVDPRLVELYDIENPRGSDTDFYLQLALELQAKTIIDLGCGTGLLTQELVTGDRHVIGIDPSVAMLAYAQRQPDAGNVQWINGGAADLGARQADLVLMTGNVAQVFLDEDEWTATLHAIYATLKPNGYVAFESRNPAAKAWEQWTPKSTFQQVESPYGPIESWLEVVKIQDNKIEFKGYNRFKNTNEEIIVSSTLCFRSYAEIAGALENIGFKLEHVYGNWQRELFRGSSRTMVFVARKA